MARWDVPATGPTVCTIQTTDNAVAIQMANAAKPVIVTIEVAEEIRRALGLAIGHVNPGTSGRGEQQ